MKRILFILIIISINANGQTIRGFLYDSEGVVPYFPISNISQEINFTTSETGYFEITASVGDTILLNSISYTIYEFKAELKDFDRDIVIKLKPASLEEVRINAHKSMEVDIENLDSVLHQKILRSIEKNPSFYEPPKGNIRNLLELAKGLIKDKERKTEKDVVQEIRLYNNDYKKLFENDDLFTTAFLEEELLIPKQYHHLFFDYLVTKNLNSSFLQEAKRLELIEVVFEAGKEYKEIIDSHLR